MSWDESIQCHPCSDATDVADLSRAHLQGLTAPMDGMWQDGFIGPASHWLLHHGDDRAGYAVIDDEGTLLAFHVRPRFVDQARAFFDCVRNLDVVRKATVATVDPLYLALCLDVQKTVRVHTLLYGVDPRNGYAPGPRTDADLRPVTEDELDRTIAFQEACLGGDTSLSAWLREYSGRLIGRGELLVLARDDGRWLGLGEQRASPSQEEITDLGMMVHPDHRGQGLATWILATLRERTAALGRTAICSTTVENVGAQKAIARAGFTSRHRMLDVTW